MAVDAAPATEGTGGGFSTTYTVDESVDEHDIVKYDGTVLAVAPSRSACCFILEDSPAAESTDVLPPESQPDTSALRLFTTDPALGAATLTAIQLPEEMTTEGCIWRAIAFTACCRVAGGAHLVPDTSNRDTGRTSKSNYRPTTSVIPLRADESPANEGGLVSSRRTGDDIFLVTRHTPAIEVWCPTPLLRQRRWATPTPWQILTRVTCYDIS